MNNCGHFQIALTTSTPKLLSSVILDPEEARAPITWLSIQAESANAAVAYVGFSSSVLSSTSFFVRIEVPVSTVPAAPFIIENTILSLDKVQVLGSTNDELQIGYIRS